MSTRIREFRKLRGMTLQFLAQKVGTTAQTIQRLETGNMTVSLDWLQRIAEVFGVPAAALLVSDTTASMPILGVVGASGEVVALSASEPVRALSLVVAAPNSVAVRVSEKLTTFEAETILICTKIDFDLEVLLEARECLIGLKSGRIIFRRVTCDGSKVVIQSVQSIGFSDEEEIAIDWVAPVAMAIRYY